MSLLPYGSAPANITKLLPSQTGNSGKALSTNGLGTLSWIPVGTGTVTTLSVVTNQGVSGSVANPTTAPAVTLTLGALTGVTSYNGLVVTANTGAITTGSWAATAIPLTKGGTGADLSAVAKGGLISGTGAGTVGLTTVGSDGQVLSADAASTGGIKWIAAGAGTVTTVSVVTANGISGSVANPTTAPAITLTLGAITPTTVNGNTLTTGTGTITITGTKTLTVADTASVSGTNTGDNSSSNLLALNSGGTAANLTASNGGIFYSTASAGAILAGTATASKMLLSGSSTTPTWSTSTIPTSAGATANKLLLSDGTNYVLSTPTFPNASATSGKLIQSDGTNWVASTATHPTAATNNKIIVGNGTNYVESTPTFPNASATSGKIIKSDGTNWVASTETYAAPGTSGNVMTSDGTNWTSAAAGGGSVMTLLHQGSGNDTSGPADNADTYAVSGLTAKDTLYINISCAAVGGNTNSLKIYNNTDSVTIMDLLAGGSALTSGNDATIEAWIQPSQTVNTTFVTNTLDGQWPTGSGQTGTSVTRLGSYAQTQAWTGSWTIALRQGGGTSFKWRWTIYKIAGQ